MLKALRALRRLFLVDRPPTIHLDFSNTKRLFAEGTLLFYAEILRLIKATAGTIELRVTMPNVDKVCQVFEQIGFCRLVGVTTQSMPQDDDVVHWRFARGHLAEGEKYDDILADYDGAIATPLQELLYTGITEAMTNVMNHAYDVPRGDGYKVSAEKEWWMFSQYREGTLSVVFCDLGAGIPVTLPMKRPKVWERFLLLGHNRDSAAIGYSVRDSVSRTKLDHRGKGLGQIVRIVDELPKGRVVIFSNRGVFLREGQADRRRDYNDSIYGTMIHWKFSIESRDMQ